MLGRNRPGSEGNLASDFENQDHAVIPTGDADAVKAAAEAPKPEKSAAKKKPAAAKKTAAKKKTPAKSKGKK